MLVRPPCWPNARLPNSKTLRKFYFFEYQVFRAILQIELNLCKIYYSGMPFGQIMYDGGTLKNKQKYQTVASKHLCPSSSRHRYSLLGGYTKGVINVQTGLFGEEQITFGKLMNWPPIETGGA